MNKHTITGIIILMTLSLLGIILFQLYWINHAMQLKEEEFDRQVNEALKNVVSKLETQEAVDVFAQRIKTVQLAGGPHLPFPERKKFTKPLNNLTPAPPPIRIQSIRKDTLPQRSANNTSQVIRAVKPSTNNYSNPKTPAAFPALQTLDSATLIKLINLKTEVDSGHLHARVNQYFLWVGHDSINQRVFQRYSIRASGLPNRQFLPNAFYQIGVSKNIAYPMEAEMVTLAPGQLPPTNKPTENKPATISTEQKKKVSAKTNQLTDVIQKMAVEYVQKSLPIEARITRPELDSLLTIALHQANIFLPYAFAVVTNQSPNRIPVHSVNFRPALVKSKYQVKLFPNDIYSTPYFLTLHFQDRNHYLLYSFRYIMGFSVLFTLIILSTFVVTVYTILKQKKIAAIKNDFINNMTHEFKTPLATISLAVDSIANSKILENKDRIRHYAGIIRAENKRMNKQVEEVLQMALLDKEELKLNQQPLDMHVLIKQSIQNMQLLLESKEAVITAQLEAPNPFVSGDEAHLGNVLVNLLDNAIKYTADAPQIKISTSQDRECLVITVEDNGIGMSRETQRLIFEKFYRVSTGNLHTVKGFGLGLTYVKAIVLAHKGSITVKSELNRGSKFEVKIPAFKSI